MGDFVIHACNDLVHGEFELIAAYNQAIRGVPEPHVADELEALRLESQQHVHDLTALVRALGGVPADPGGAGERVRATAARLAAMVGTEALLRALLYLEDSLHLRYDRRLAEPLPPHVLELLGRCRADVERHRDWVRRALVARLWEQPRPSPPPG